MAYWLGRGKESESEIPRTRDKKVDIEGRARTQEMYFIFQVIAQWKLDLSTFHSTPKMIP